MDVILDDDLHAYVLEMNDGPLLVAGCPDKWKWRLKRCVLCDSINLGAHLTRGVDFINTKRRCLDSLEAFGDGNTESARAQCKSLYENYENPEFRTKKTVLASQEDYAEDDKVLLCSMTPLDAQMLVQFEEERARMKFGDYRVLYPRNWEHIEE